MFDLIILIILFTLAHEEPLLENFHVVNNVSTPIDAKCKKIVRHKVEMAAV